MGGCVVQTVHAGQSVARGIGLAFTAGSQLAFGYAREALKYAERTVVTAIGARYSALAFDAKGAAVLPFADEVNGAGRPTRWSSLGRPETHDHRDARRIRRRRMDAAGTGTQLRPGLVVDAGPSTGLVRFWQKYGGAWQLEQVGSGFRPALLVRQGVAMVSFVTQIRHRLVLAKRGADAWVDQMSRARRSGLAGQPRRVLLH